MYIYAINKTVCLVWTELTACACCEGVPCVNAPGEAGLGGCAYGKPDCPKKQARHLCPKNNKSNEIQVFKDERMNICHNAAHYKAVLIEI